MRSFRPLVGLVACLCLFRSLPACGLAGDLNSPSLSLPTETPEAFRTNLLAAISEKELGFKDGHFVNSSTTMHYEGTTPALNRMITRLSGLDGLHVVVTFVKEPGGPSWTLTHTGWSDPKSLFLEVNVSATAITLEDLQIVVVGRAQRG